MFIIDFDDTLFDTHAFKQARMASLQSLGVTEELFRRTYAQSRNDAHGAFTYTDERHAQILGVEGFEEAKVQAALQSVSYRVKEFLFEDTLRFLQGVRDLGDAMILLSLGEPSFQEFKVKQTRTHKFFDRMFMAEESKERIVKEILDHHSPTYAWFINDKVKETVDITKKFSVLRPVLKQSPNIPLEEYSQSGMPYFETLDEILHYVKKPTR